ncbi:MAG: hypothetical protein ACR2G4_12365 [Pyrinomonadaceae bacterium]
MRKVIISLWMFVAVTVCFAQADMERSTKHSKPDLSGTWVLDKSKSHKVDADHFNLVIVHREPEIRMTEISVKDGRELTNDSVHYTDGRSDSDTAKGIQYSKIKIRWRGETLVRENIHTTTGVRFEMVTTEEWKVSKDSKSLTRTIVSRQKTSTNETILPRMEKQYVFTRSS